MDTKFPMCVEKSEWSDSFLTSRSVVQPLRLHIITQLFLQPFWNIWKLSSECIHKMLITCNDGSIAYFIIFNLIKLQRVSLETWEKISLFGEKIYLKVLTQYKSDRKEKNSDSKEKWCEIRVWKWYVIWLEIPLRNPQVNFESYIYR